MGVIPEIVVVIPTIPERKESLEVCVAKYTMTLEGVPHEIKTIHGCDTCGEGWDIGVRYALSVGSKYVHITADDIDPLPGWYQTAVEVMDAGFLPTQWMDDRGVGISYPGQFEDWDEEIACSLPFCFTEDAAEILPYPHLHTPIDLWWSAMMRRNGHRWCYHHGFGFVHRADPRGRRERPDDGDLWRRLMMEDGLREWTNDAGRQWVW
jgi:hypothetical protein